LLDRGAVPSLKSTTTWSGAWAGLSAGAASAPTVWGSVRTRASASEATIANNRFMRHYLLWKWGFYHSPRRGNDRRMKGCSTWRTLASRETRSFAALVTDVGIYRWNCWSGFSQRTKSGGAFAVDRSGCGLMK